LYTSAARMRIVDANQAKLVETTLPDESIE
jgi:hypothetical protein